MSQDILYLGSQSPARLKLLQTAGISCHVISHSSDEEVENDENNFSEYVLAVALSKMHSLQLPQVSSVVEPYLFVLTADTLVREPRQGTILGKPGSRTEALAMLALQREGPVEVLTGCCVSKFQAHGDSWNLIESRTWTSGAMIEFFLDEDEREAYLNDIPITMNCAGAATVEGYGSSFLKSVNGSYSAVIGLPVYEVRQTLKSFGFRF